MNTSTDKEIKLEFELELCSNGSIITFQDDYLRYVVEGNQEAYNAIITNEIKGAIDNIKSSDKYLIEIKVTSL